MAQCVWRVAVGLEGGPRLGPNGVVCSGPYDLQFISRYAFRIYIKFFFNLNDSRSSMSFYQLSSINTAKAEVPYSLKVTSAVLFTIL